MKVCIISLNPGHNYGGIIQSYALQSVLEKLGHNVAIITHRYMWEDGLGWKKIYVYPKRLIFRYFFKKTIPIHLEEENRFRQQHIYSNLLRFVSEKLKTLRINNFNEIDASLFDAFVVGSDQVWRPRYFKEQFQTSIDKAFLSFTKRWNVKRIAYAPSFSVDDWEYSCSETLKCKKALEKFNAVSVRESSGVRLLKEYLDVNAQKLPDPAFLLQVDDYLNLMKGTQLKESSEGLFIYMLDYNNDIKDIASSFPDEIHQYVFEGYPSDGSEMASVEDWLNGIYHADFVLTDSFHACVFSLLFNKPFAVVINKDRGASRFSSLLDTYQQSFRLLNRSEEFFTKKDEIMQYPNVEHIIDQERTRAMEFLKQNLA